ncbi:MAG: hypothetical protein GY862_36770, partial [Gammaproteobacteria bacterium]|nr:hypothetical protein [Gammaproteobacteria bacterium]
MCNHDESARSEKSPGLAEIVRACLENYSHPLAGVQAKALHDIANCRTAALGGHLQCCDNCGTETPHYNSCRNRNCPGCQRLNGAR